MYSFYTLYYFLFQFTALHPCFAESCRESNDGFDVFSHALIQGVQDKPCRDGDECQIDGVLYFIEASINFKPQGFFAFMVDGVYFPLVPKIEQSLDKAGPVGIDAFGSADNGDRFWMEKKIEYFVGHNFPQ